MKKLSKYAKDMGLTYATAYNYWKAGTLKAIQLPTGTILVEDDPPKAVPETPRAIVYARVSSSENRDNLNSQLDRIKSYASVRGYTIVREVKEVGSGLNDTRPLLASILTNDDWDIIVVEHKDRLARFGLKYIDLLLSKLGKKIEVINQVDDTNEDLMQDLVSIITSFCARIYGLRRSKRKTETIIKELSTDD